MIGAFTGPVALFLFFASGDPRMLIEPARHLGTVTPPPLVLGGALAGWLAERRVSPRSLRWWAATLGVAVLGAVAMQQLHGPR